MEKRLIEANVLMDCINKEKAPIWWKELITGWINKQPTIDAVRVVRCNDCDHMKWKKSIYADGTINWCRRCELDNKKHPNGWFCADGKLKGGIED